VGNFPQRGSVDQLAVLARRMRDEQEVQDHRPLREEEAESNQQDVPAAFRDRGAARALSRSASNGTSDTPKHGSALSQLTR
jgi:hypothetical protein